MWTFLLLGLIQGLTEFLPISSSGHLALSEAWMQVEKPGLLFDALVHLATVGSVIFFYRKRFVELLKSPFSESSKLWWKTLFLATLPTVIIGFTLKEFVETAFETPAMVATGLLWTGIILFMSPRWIQENRELDQLSIWQLFTIGLAQGLAIFPGVSRSGMTIAAALLMGLNREKAAEFSFLLAIPAILGATVLQLFEALDDWEAHTALLVNYAGGAAVALISGIIAIGLMIRVLQQGKLRLFAYYCWLLGLAVLAWVLWA